MSFLGGTPVTGPRSGILRWGTPILGWGTPWPGQDGGTPRQGTPSRPGMGYPPPLGYVMLRQVMPRAVRFLRFPAGGLSCFTIMFKAFMLYVPHRRTISDTA